MKPVDLVVATKGDSIYFNSMPLGRTIGRLRGRFRSITAVHNNTYGMGTVYNKFLTTEYEDSILLLIHDDVYIEDYWIAQRLNEAIEKYDVVGVAGQSYPFPDTEWVNKEGNKCIAHWDAGSVSMGTEPMSSRLLFDNRAPERCYALDGQLLALNMSKVLESGAKFDEQFAYSFYDTDFCRTCTKSGLVLGVWPIAVTHQSSGRAVGTEAWYREMEKYKEKWNG